MEFTRRQFLMGCSATIAAMAGGRIGDLVFASHDEPGIAAAASDELLVVVFLRGGCDGLSLVSPFDDTHYVTARGDLKIPDTGTNKALLIDPQNSSFTSSLGLHPKAAPLHELYSAKKLAIVHACGLDDATRSHFDAMDYIERGTPGNKNTSSGWITRHLQSIGVSGTLPVVASAPNAPASLLGDPNAVAMTDPKSYGLSAPSRYSSAVFTSLKQFYNGSGPLHLAGQRTIATIESLKAHDLNYTPSVTYPTSSFGNALRLVAQLIKLDVGLRVATVDLGGWDTHENQGASGGGYFANLVDTFSRGLHAFYNDLAMYQSKLTVVVMSEFGRRLGTNVSGGTDHGHGNMMLVLGGMVNGGKVYGSWPGLVDLDQAEDLKITTDFRTILSEIVVRRLGNPKLGIVFPGVTAYKPLNITGTAAEDRPIEFTTGDVYLPLVSLRS